MPFFDYTLIFFLLAQFLIKLLVIVVTIPGYLLPFQCILDTAVRFIDMNASQKTTLLRRLRKFRIIISQLFLLNFRKTQRGKTRRVHNIGLTANTKQLCMTRRMASAFDLAADLSGLHLSLRK